MPGRPSTRRWCCSPTTGSSWASRTTSCGDARLVLDRLQPLLAPRARIFGATIVQGDAPRSRAAQSLMNLYNRKGIFANSRDTAQQLEAELRRRFSDVGIRMLGTVAIFEARAR